MRVLRPGAGISQGMDMGSKSTTAQARTNLDWLLRTKVIAAWRERTTDEGYRTFYVRTHDGKEHAYNKHQVIAFYAGTVAGRQHERARGGGVDDALLGAEGRY